jgi:hypothetical protein
MNRKLKLLFFFLTIFRGIIIFAQDIQPLPGSFYRFRDTIYMQNTSAAQIVTLYTVVKEEIEKTGSSHLMGTPLCGYNSHI